MKETRSAVAPVQMRVGRDEREVCVDVLQEHYAAGRLDEDELSDRVHQALTATTAADLEVLVHDLPGPRQHRDRRVPPTRRRRWVAGAAAAALVMGAAALFGGDPAAPAAAPDWCVSTGQPTGPGTGCPDVSPAQQRIFQDVTRADAAAQQLQELSDENAEWQLSGLAKRAQVQAGRATTASLDAQALVAATTWDDPPEASLADLARTSRQAADAAEEAVDQALDKIGDR